MTDPLAPILVSLHEIDEAALPRDRAGVESEPLDELVTSLLLNGLRQPVELWRLSEPHGSYLYGLISGFRRLAAFRALHRDGENPKWQSIPAFIRTPATYAEAFAAMVEENEIRSELSPWEKGRICVVARDEGIFPSIEEALNTLFPAATGAKKSRLRTIAMVADDLGNYLDTPERLSQQQLLRLAAAFRLGYGPVIYAALEESSARGLEAQWAVVKPILLEAETAFAEDPVRASGDRPRRVSRPRPGLTIRREMTKDGWILRFTGRDATGIMINTVMDEIERMYAPR